jgi:hypothetical protein
MRLAARDEAVNSLVAIHNRCLHWNVRLSCAEAFHMNGDVTWVAENIFAIEYDIENATQCSSACSASARWPSLEICHASYFFDHA